LTQAIKTLPETADAVPSIVAEKLRALIACGTFAPGVRLGQTDLAQQFQASRVPIREALKLLSAEGIVEHDPNRGFFVKPWSSHEARQYFRLRDMVEDELLSSIRWPTNEEIAEFRRHAAMLEQLLDQGNRTEWWSQHQQFHLNIFNLSPQKILVQEAMRYWALTDRYRVLVPLPRRESPGRNIVNKADLIDALEGHRIRELLNVRASRRKAFEDAVLEVLEDRGL
jgi:DNA-binding GntR family transcriptional regulator